ncbi:MAG TPA: hypothetical protein VKF59_23350 [Candidatus Dormibacteraeota bacterium]|nr:hypothetical protein [Candidatus Dormibacteraeota bacterium]
MSRRGARFRLAMAYGRHRLRRRFQTPLPSTAEDVLAGRAEDRLRPVTAEERALMPLAARCIGCGLCALVVKRAAGARLPDLAAAYLRDPTLLPDAAADLGGDPPPADALAAAAAVCPVGVPLPELLATAQRLSRNTP